MVEDRCTVSIKVN